MSPKKESQSYQEMLESIEKIIHDISSEKIDLDEMIDKVETGYGLLDKMNMRLKGATDKLTKLKTLYETKEKQDKNES